MKGREDVIASWGRIVLRSGSRVMHMNRIDYARNIFATVSTDFSLTEREPSTACGILLLGSVCSIPTTL